MADNSPKQKMQCDHCGARFSFSEKLIGKELPCPKCSEKILIRPNLDGADMVTSAGSDDSAPEAPAAPLSSRMKANKAVAGQICPACEEEIELGDDIYNCPSCNCTMHDQCYADTGGCANPNCSDYASGEDEGGADDASGVPAEGDDRPTKECPHCGETILASAKKCRFCKEILDERMREREARRNASNDSDDNLSGGEIALGILCSGIACIAGLIWGCMGKKKGWKLMGIAIVTQIILGIIRALLNA